jgi:superfamily II DNA or RNA helicase
VTRYTDTELNWLDGFLSMPDESARYRRGGDAEARKPLLNALTQQFPTGLLGMVQTEAAAAGWTVELLDQRKAPCGPDPNADIEWLAPYQEEALERAAVAGRGVVWCPTGAGKGEIMVALAMLYTGCPGAIFVPTKSLLEEIASRYELRSGEKVGRIGDGEWSIERVTVATFQSVHSALKRGDKKARAWVESLGWFQCDEVHAVASNTFFSVTMACTNAYYCWGYSATPFARGDRRGLLAIAAIGPVVYRIKQEELVAMGAIARGKVQLARHILDVDTVESAGGKYGEVYDSLIAKDSARHALVVRVVKQVPKPAFVFVRLVEHGKALERMLLASGVSCEFVWGQKNAKVREAAVRRLEHGDIDVIVCNVVFQAGVNVPTLASVVNAGSGKSDIATLQQIGRGSRRRDRTGSVVKDEFTVVDIVDQNCGCKGKKAGATKYGHSACAWLEKHARARRRAYLAEGYSVEESDR